MIFDETFEVDDTTPFGFDSVSAIPAGGTQEVIPLGAEGTPSAAWSGVALRGGSASTVSFHRSYPWMGILGTIATWKQIQPTSYNAYDWPSWFDDAINDARTADLNGHPYKISLRVMMGSDAPVGPTGANWMIGGQKAANNNKPVEVVNTIGNDISGGVAAVNIPVAWDANYRYHHDRLLAWIETQLAGTTGLGVTRSDYVFMLAVAMPTEKGSEMQIGYGSHTRIPASGSITVDGKTYTPSSPGYIDLINKASWAKHVPSAVRSQGQTAINSWLAGQYRDSWAYAIQKHMDVITSVDSSVAWAGLFSDGLAGARALVKQFVPIYGRSKLISLTTSLRVYPPTVNGVRNWNAPKSQWSYRNFSPTLCDLMLLVKSLVPSGTLPKMGFQTAGSQSSTNGYGMPPKDFPYAAKDGFTLYGAQFIETYPGVFTSTADGAANRSYAQNTLQPALVANAVLVDAAAPSGFDNVFHVSLPASPSGTDYGTVGFPDEEDATYLIEVATYSLTTTTPLLTSFTTGATGFLDFAIDELGHPHVLWDAVDVWADQTITIQPGDVVEVRHFVNAAASGFEVRINQELVVTADALTSDGLGINSIRVGLLEAAEGDAQISRVAIDTTWIAGPTITPAGDPPSLAVTPLPGTLSSTSIQVTAVATSDAGILSVTASPNDSPSQALSPTQNPGEYRATITGLVGSAGQSVPNTITVEALDASAQQQSTTIVLGIAVQLPQGAGGGGSAVAFTKTLFLGTGQFAAMNDRFMTLGHYVEGIAPDVDTDNGGDATAALVVTQTDSDTVSIAAGWALVQGDDTDFQGMYADFNDAATALTQTDGAPGGGNQRVDIVVATINDSEHTARTPQDFMYFDFVTGAESAGADLTDTSTWPDLPPSCLPLALVQFDSGGIADILDCRKAYGPSIWGADGGRYRLAVTADKLLGLEEVLPWPEWVVTA